MEKITKKQMFEGMVAYFRGEDTAISEAQFEEFCQKQIADLDKKAAKSKERAAAKRAEGDELTDAVYAVITDEFQTIADIATAVLANMEEGADISTQKITARLTKLVKAELVEKDQVSIEGEDGKKTKKMAYRLAVASEEVEDEE